MPLSQEILAIIHEEEESLARIRSLLDGETGRKALYESFAAEMQEIREALPTAGNEEYPHLLTRFDLLKQQVQAAGETELPDRDAPYFARMILEEDGKRHDVLLGHRAWMNIDLKLVIVDWKKTPLAQIFYSCDPGETYSVSLPDGRTRSGILKERRLLSITEGRLIGLRTGETALIRNDDGVWAERDTDTGPSVETGDRRWHLKPALPGASISAFLDREQYRILRDDDALTMIIRGGAGSGKTTVLVHRLASVFARSENPDDHLLLVPEPGIAGSCRDQLRLLGVRGVPVHHYPEWTGTACRRLFRRIPDRIIHNTPFTVSRFKRHPAMLTAVRTLGLRQKNGLLERIGRRKTIGPLILEGIGDTGPMNVRQIIDAARRVSGKLVDTRPDFRTLRSPMDKFFREEEARLYDFNADRRELLLSRQLLEEVVNKSESELRQKTIGEIIRRTTHQLAKSASEEIAELYPERTRDFRTLDGAAIDSGTPGELAGTMDREDATLMLLLLLEKTGNLATPEARIQTRTHLYLDESQEFSPLELSLLCAVTGPSTRIAAGGDFTQLMRPVTSKQGWETLLAAFGRKDAVFGTLRINYRATAEIAEFNRTVLGEFAGDDIPETRTQGDPVRYSVYPDNTQRAMALSEALIALRKQYPRATVAVIAPSPRRAREDYRELQGIPGTRLSEHGMYDLRPGITVTTVDRVKGLEFDLVILTEADGEQYPDTLLSRRQLHVAASRAMQALWVTSSGEFSPVIPTEK